MTGVAPGSGIQGVIVKDEGAVVVSPASTINLVGTTVVVTQDPSDPNQANVTVSGSGGGSSNSYFPSGW
jgi:hypothetical protein